MNLVSFFALLAILMATGCRSSRPEMLDSWYHEPRPEFVSSNRLETTVFEVVAAQVAYAEAMLEKKSFVELPLNVAREFSSNELDARRQWYLVRGLECSPNGSWGLHYRKTELQVSHWAIGGPRQMRRQPIVIALEYRPEVVYVVCGCAQ